MIGTPDLLANLPASNFSRLVWHNEPSRKRFERILSEYSDAWLEAEQMSVLEGVRDLCLQPMAQHEYLAFLPWAHDNGLHVRVKRFAGAFRGFSHYYESGTETVVVAMSRDREKVESENCEQFLGYPKCCQEFFADNFPKYIDPILQWADNGDSAVSSAACNPVLRSLGLRLVSHIPCNGRCSASDLIGSGMSALLSKEQVDAATEILEAPMSWDCYRGIAIAKTPWFRTIYRSVPYKERVLVNINAGS